MLELVLADVSAVVKFNKKKILGKINLTLYTL